MKRTIGSSTCNTCMYLCLPVLLLLTVTGYSQSVKLNGTNSYVSVGNHSSLHLTNFTLEAWIRIEGAGVTTSTSGSNGFTDVVPVIAKGRSESESAAVDVNYFMGYQPSTNKLIADFEDNATSANHPVSSNTTLTASVWTHVAVSFNVSTNTWKLYINGVLDRTLSLGATTFTPQSLSNVNACIGSAFNSTGTAAGFFNGRIDEVRIWNGVRSDGDIAANYNVQLTSGTGLVDRWGLNEGSGTTAVNSIAGAPNGTLTGGATWIASGFESVAPNQPTSPSPGNNSGSPDTHPSICATVTDPNGGNLRVRFFGRRKQVVNNGGKFTVIFLPDTQFYTEQPQGNTNGGNNAMYKAQTNWIAANRQAMNIAFVGHLGDCSENGDNPPGVDEEIEYKRADTAMKIIESPALTGLAEGIPYGVCVGNHDQTPNGSPTGTTNNFNKYFGEARFTGRSYYGGHKGTNNDNHYEFFSAGGINFLVISLEYDQTSGFAVAGGALDWAEGLVQSFPNHKVIVMTHYAINETPSFSPLGQSLYDRLKIYPNFSLFVGGHIHTTDGEARRTDVFNGNTVHSIMSDYQGRPGGGNGLLRIFEFDPSQNKISVKTYSPFLNTFETDADSQFDLAMNMESNPFTLLGEVNNVASGSNACFTWSGLLDATEYEWYTELFDGDNTTTGAVWTFTTPAAGPLPVDLINFTAKAENDSRVKISWSTTFELNNSHFEVERSGDGITFSNIGHVSSKGNSNRLVNYNTYDEQPLRGISYYRLKQVDLDGKSAATKIVSVNIAESAGVDVFPNPVRENKFTVRFKNAALGKINVQVYDMSGRLHMTQQSNVLNGRILVEHHLSPGSYIVHVTGNTVNEKKLIVISN